MIHSDKINVTRREFLRRSSALAATGLALPTLIPRSVLAAPGQPGASDRIGIGYIGIGRRAQQLLDLPKECQIVAVADVHLKNAGAFAAKRQCQAFQDYRKLLESKEVQAVVVASPDHWHALHSVHACQAGKDVYVEKPMTLTIREGRIMVNAARQYQRIVQVGSQQRSMPANRRGCELVRHGAIGKVHTVIGHNYASPWECAFPGEPVPAGLDWDAWCGQTEPVPFHTDIYISRRNPGWISFRPYSGGEMTGWGAHGLDQVQWALGMDESGPVEIWTEGGKFAPPVYAKPESRQRGEDVCGQPKVFFRYANGVLFKLENGPDGGAIFMGDKGKITIDRNVCKVEPPELAGPPPGRDAVRPNVGDPHIKNWIDCIKSRERPVADVEIGHRSTTVCHLGNIARWMGRKLHWDPIKEIFPGDDEANGLVQRPQRKPYQLPEPV